MLSEGGWGGGLVVSFFQLIACTFPSAAIALSTYQTINYVMANSSIVTSVALNAVPYPSWPRVIPPPYDINF